MAGDIVPVPALGRVTVERLRGTTDIHQGVDLGVRQGGIVVPGVGPVTLLRTWFDDDLPLRVEYDYFADDELLLTSNVYEVEHDGRMFEERWTENAGMLIEPTGPLERIYSCSAGPRETPAFDDLAYRLVVTPLNQ